MKFRHLPEMAEPPVFTPDYKIFVKQEPTVPKSLSSTLCHCNSKSNEASHQCLLWGSGKAALRMLCNTGTERESSQNKGKERSFQKRRVLWVIPCFGVNKSKQHYLHFW